MLHTSLVVELLRSQPRLMFWLGALAQGALWWLVPSLFYASPPGDLPLVLAVGHEFQLGSAFGPPLAFWLAEVAYRVAGAPGVYLLAQVCVVTAYYGAFTLARAIVGVHHAVFAVLLMTGILAFAAPTPDFGPAILALPFTVFTLVYLWQALSERRRMAWFLLALNLGLLLLTTWAGLILAFAIAVFLAATRRGRLALQRPEPWLASIVIVAVLFPHLIWIDLGRNRLFDLLAPAVDGHSWLGNLSTFIATLLLSHVGLMLLAVLAVRWRTEPNEKVPVFVRSFTSRFGARFVYFFAAVPAVIAALFAGFSATPLAPGSVAPYVALSGLVIVVLAGNSIFWPRPQVVATAWALLLLAPPLGVAVAIVGLPWLGVADTGVDRPAAAIGRYLADNFARRTGAPLAIVTGDPRMAAVVALGAPGRPSLYLDASPGRTPWVTADDIRRKGAVVVWQSPDTRAEVPPAVAAHFPGLVAEVPRTFERAFQGRLPLLRIGFAVMRPQADAPAPNAAKPAQ
ncbi:MAG: glycosyltransferase family 39 protein [Bradyrhizobiaceae bacterium]|nr:glycosyltransferase family 39 protein [Bradyrhizobiaceae bacterium]